MRPAKVVWEILKVVIGVVIAAFIIRFFLFQPFVVEGSSMEPSFHNGEYLFIEKVTYDFREPKRGEVIVFEYPLDTSTDYIKRIIGLPGDEVRIENGEVLVNGKVLKEDYLYPGQKTVLLSTSVTSYKVTVGADEYFVMGDNRDHSADSREGWVVPKKNIIGRTALVLLPAHDFHAVGAPNY